MQVAERVEIKASPERVYALVADMPRMGEWSPECRRVEWQNGATGPVVGAEFIGHNRSGPLRWSRRGRVLTADPGREFAFATEEGGREGCLWRYRFTETDAGTTTTEESFEIVWLPRWIRIADVITFRRGQVHRGMRRTLERLKAAAEAT